MPIGKWLRRGPKDDLTETLLGGDSCDYFDKRFIRAIISDHMKDISDNRKLLWTLFVFEKWKQANGY